MDVEVDLYSGRPNPRFSLGPTTTAELMHRLASLPPLLGSATPRATLGYRGLRVDADVIESTITEIVVSGGAVFVRDRAGTQRVLEDRERSLERWLVEAGAGQLDPDEVAVLDQDLKS
jgi:hypothetical protein